jgi:hypothetical protein
MLAIYCHMMQVESKKRKQGLGGLQLERKMCSVLSFTWRAQIKTLLQ